MNQFDKTCPYCKILPKNGSFHQVGKLDQVGYFDPLQTLVVQKLPYPTPIPPIIKALCNSLTQ